MTKEIENSTKQIIETGLNQKFFKETIENSHLSEEDKKILGDLDKKWKQDQALEILKEEDKSKIQTYEELKVEDLPKDWRNRLTRLKHLEKLLADYEPKIAELKTWTDTFGEKKPEEVQEKFTNLEKEYSDFKQKSEERIQELTERSELAENKVQEWELTFPNQNALTVSQEKEELKKNLGEWIENWGGKELEEVKAEWEELQKRPNIAITEPQFWDDYVRREKKEQSSLKDKELIQTQTKLEEEVIKNKKLGQAVSQILNNIIIQRYTLPSEFKPVANANQARDAVAELLEETGKKWQDYLEGSGEIIGLQSLALALSLSFQPEKKELVHQVLGWMEEVKETGDYQTLFEKWSGGAEYNKENDLDGSLRLLEKRLEEMKEEETAL